MPEVKNDHIEEITLRSEEVQEILSDPPHWMIRWGNLVFLALIIMVLAVSWFVKYPDIIISEALITTNTPPHKEYAKISGKIQEIFVNNNDLVSANSPLAILENTANYEDVFKLKSVIDTITFNRKTFSFPIDSLELLFLGDIESQYALFENNYIQYVLNKQLEPFTNQALATKYSITELNNRLTSLIAQRDINKNELNYKLADLNRQKALFNKGVISAQEYENKEIEYAQFERNYKNFENSISQLKETINNTYRNSRDIEINRVKEEKVLLRNVFQSFNQLKNAIKDWENRFVLKSNIEGKVSFLNYWAVNQAVNQGDLIFIVIPTKNSSFIGKLTTPSQNSGKIKKGQKVNIKLENYPETEFGVLNGIIEHISIVPNSDGFYIVDVSLPNNMMTSYNKTIEFKQEMRGAAEIITEDLRLIERFFYQFKSVLDR
ncbi:HlyD family secretion protein [Winogradskyella sp.]|uniref:HlyD family secretion protein n=1 Tax=Winogradskyella sp. TaxID=1883156 RepID=UPI003BAA1E1B